MPPALLQSALTLACLLAVGVSGAGASAEAPNSSAAFKADEASAQRATGLSADLADQLPENLFAGRRRQDTLAIQVRLDQARFSPGPIDGVWGSNTARAIRAFERAQGLAVDGKADPELIRRLAAAGSGAVLKTYTLQPSDTAGPFLASIPAGMTAQAELSRLGYTSPQELLAEKFHMSVGLLEALNPDADFGQSGAQILVADAGSDKLAAGVSRIVVDKAREEVRAYAGNGKLLARYPATIGSRSLPSPSGAMKVRAIAPDPAYYFNPEGRSWGPDKRLKIAPGPNNPVGAMWIDLTKEGYGIHGSPAPRMISKQASHGCVRLTNWDARELGSADVVGAEVVFTS